MSVIPDQALFDALMAVGVLNHEGNPREGGTWIDAHHFQLADGITLSLQQPEHGTQIVMRRPKVGKESDDSVTRYAAVKGGGGTFANTIASLRDTMRGHAA